MKRSTIYQTAISLAAASLVAAAGIAAGFSQQGSAVSHDSEPIALATSTTNAPALAVKDETVYAITDNSGVPNKIFVNNTLYTGNNSLPVEMYVSFELDGNSISPAELRGKSGHVTISFEFTTSGEHLGAKIPFLAITSLTLDQNIFSNLSIDNGKIMSVGENLIAVGYAMPGVGDNFATDLIPDSFTVEADVTNFALGNTYTIFSNDFFQDVDTSGLAKIDDLRDSMNTLSDGLDRIISGATDLSDGLENLLAGTKTLAEGTSELVGGLDSAATGASDLSTGLAYITSNNDALQTGATVIMNSTLEKLAASGIEVTAENYDEVLTATLGNLETSLARLQAHPELAPADTVESLNANIASMTEAKSLLDFGSGVIAYTAGVASAASGAADLADGLSLMSGKAPELTAGVASLIDGATKLYNGSVTLQDGLTTLKTSGIDRLVAFANHDLANFTLSARRTVEAASSYNYFDNPSASSVKFIFKTASIK